MKVNRKRNHAVTIRMTEGEYEELMEKVEASGLTQQSYFINAARGAAITPSDEIAVLKEISKTFAGYERQLRGLATNVNQLAHIANGTGNLPTALQLDNLSAQISTYRKEGQEIWQSIRSSINQQKHTQP